MARGFLSFAMAAVFLLALVSSGLRLSEKSPDYSYEKYRAAQVSEIAIKRAFYLSVSETANGAYNASAAAALALAGADPREAVKSAVFLRALEFESQLSSQGYDVVFWCGEISEGERQKASSQMQLEKKALAPQGSLPLAQCADSFEANTLHRKLHLSNLGFSIYQPLLGTGRAAVLPAAYEADF